MVVVVVKVLITSEFVANFALDIRLYNNMNGCSCNESVNSVKGCCYFALVIRLKGESVIEGKVVAILHLPSDCIIT